MPFAAPLNWPMTLILTTWTLMMVLTLTWWIQLPALPTLTRPSMTLCSLWPW